MATRRGGTSRGRTTARTRRSRSSGPQLTPELTRQIIAIVLLVAGAVTLIALMLPGQGLLNQYVEKILRPLFGQGAWILPIVLLVAGVLVERGAARGGGPEITAAGAVLLLVGGLGMLHLTLGEGTKPADLKAGGGWVGSSVSHILSSLFSAPGAFVVLLGMLVAGVVLLFNTTIRDLLRPVTEGGRAIAGALSNPVAPPERGAAGRTGTTQGRASDFAMKERAPELPEPVPSPLPMSQTVWAGGGAASGAAGATTLAGTVAAGTAAGSVAVAGSGAAASTVGREAGRPVDLLLEAEDAPAATGDMPWVLPDAQVLDEHREGNGSAMLDHQRNRRIIEEKLRSFQIEAQVDHWNEGPVVTQYEVRPNAQVKLSRIEALQDDLAMALAARSIRIEAPIPGKDVVGVEVPNHSAEVVGFRGIWDDAHMADAPGRLTFALGRDVSGQAFAVDLAKMPHLLIAGATGSGKSVCVNALIVSLLMRARPKEVRLILVDLKRVELSAYDGLPHLLTNVIVEPGDAKAALNWCVRQMEERYKALAAKTERNIAAYNASARVAPEERLPYIVIIVDELADLMMREGRKVEDPIVKLAQKARAVGIHLVLATQRPSVNVVTGLIKANVPSRIAFAMASNVDSRTVLDAQGAEDLIGRGDMLYQPADVPRPVRLQGVFVSDREVRAVTEVWRAQAPEPVYDPDVTAGVEGEGGEGGQFAWLTGIVDDDLTPRAADLVVSSGKASTSMLQTKLKIGFNRASRVIDELERVGIVGPQDPRNPAVPRVVYGPENWLRSLDDEQP